MSKTFTVYPIDGSKPYKATYRKYINSGDWRMKADRFKEQAGHKCQECGLYNDSSAPFGALPGVVFHVHHLHYRTLGREQASDVKVVCSWCHKLLHNEQGRKWR